MLGKLINKLIGGPSSTKVSEPNTPYSEIEKCIRRKKTISFTYMDKNGERTLRKVLPKEIFLSDPRNSYAYELYILRAHCYLRDAERFFVLKRMENIKIL